MANCGIKRVMKVSVKIAGVPNLTIAIHGAVAIILWLMREGFSSKANWAAMAEASFAEEIWATAPKIPLESSTKA